MILPEVLEIFREKYNNFFCEHNHMSEEAVALAYTINGCGRLFHGEGLYCRVIMSQNEAATAETTKFVLFHLRFSDNGGGPIQKRLFRHSVNLNYR
jgi:hypothetical protein